MRINADEFWSRTGHRLTLTIVDETEDMIASFSTIVFFYNIRIPRRIKRRTFGRTAKVFVNLNSNLVVG